LGIDQKATERYRKDNQIPDSDWFAMIMPRGKRGTMSTIYLINIIQSHLKLLYNFKWFIPSEKCIYKYPLDLWYVRII
jgi:hypothetical protein